MPRRKRQESPTGVYHWICRGIHRKDLFHQPSDFEYFRSLLKEHKAEFNISIYHYCFMTNHVHLLIHSPDRETMGAFSHIVQRRYAYHYSARYAWIGNVFQRGYRSLPIGKDVYLLECGRYIERNPVKAGLVLDPAGYAYSSYVYYSAGEPDDLITPSPGYLGISEQEGDRMASYTMYVSESRLSEEMAHYGQAAIPF